MEQLYYFYSIGAALAVLCIIAAIVNLAAMRGISSRISLIESEIDKKASEFDALKNRAVSYEPDPASYSEPPSEAAYETGAGYAQSDEQSPQIEVVRNVRAGYAEQGASHLVNDTISMHQSQQSPPSPVNQPQECGQQEYSQQEAATPPLVHQVDPHAPLLDQYPQQPQVAEYTTTEHQQVEYTSEPMGLAEAVPPDTTYEEEILEVVNDQPCDGTIQIVLFDHATGVPLFAQASNQLSEQFSQYKQPEVFMDFSGLPTLQPQELCWIDKIVEYMQANGAVIHLIGCSHEVQQQVMSLAHLAVCMDY